MPKYAGSEWLRKHLEYPSKSKAKTVSDLGVEVADLIGDLYEGIYHLNYSALDKPDWASDRYIEVIVSGDMGTFDGNRLTRLVVLCHDRLLRCEISGCGPGYIKLGFSKRESREGRPWNRHPTIEQAVADIRHFYAVQDA